MARQDRSRNNTAGCVFKVLKPALRLYRLEEQCRRKMLHCDSSRFRFQSYIKADVRGKNANVLPVSLIPNVFNVFLMRADKCRGALMSITTLSERMASCDYCDSSRPTSDVKFGLIASVKH